MKQASLDWFKQTAEKAIEKIVAEKLENFTAEEQKVNTEKSYLRVQLVNDTLTVVLLDGTVLSKPGATQDDYIKVISSRNEYEIRCIIASSEVVSDMEKIKAEAAKLKALQKGIETLAILPDFTVEGNTVYLTGTSRSLPQLLVEKFIEIVDNVNSLDLDDVPLEEALNYDDEYVAHKNFFMWCCLNPRAEVANELYRFLSENSFKITKQGFFVALRNVVTLHGSPELVHFISNTYNKVKAVWKKNPNEYTVFLQDGEYKLVHDDKLYEQKTYTSTTCQDCEGEGQFWNDYDEYEEDYGDNIEECETCCGTGEVEEYEYTITVLVDHGQKIGGLTELYLDLPNRAENRFTDDWTKTFDIRIGQVTSMPMEECNWSTQDCAAAGLKYVASL